MNIQHRSPAHDFDFLFGSWRVQHKRLKERLAQCDQWEEFPGTTTAQPLLGGFGNMDDNVLDLPGGHYRAVTLRTFDPKTEKWAIWWLDGRTPHGLAVPMIGSFADGVGTFLADDNLAGKPIKVRFLWSRITAQTCRWEQAFSGDGGRNWETNWIMDFERSA
jgi:hypothetical protein